MEGPKNIVWIRSAWFATHPTVFTHLRQVDSSVVNANSVDPDRMLNSMSDLGLHCLPTTLS